MNPVRHQLDDRGGWKNPSMGRHCNKGSFWKGITTENDNCLGRFSCMDLMLYMKILYIFTIFPCQRLKLSKENTLKKFGSNSKVATFWWWDLAESARGCFHTTKGNPHFLHGLRLLLQKADERRCEEFIHIGYVYLWNYKLINYKYCILHMFTRWTKINRICGRVESPSKNTRYLCFLLELLMILLLLGVCK